MLGFNNTSTLWVILCRLPEKGKKRESRNEREEQARKRNRNESVPLSCLFLSFISSTLMEGLHYLSYIKGKSKVGEQFV